MTSRRARFGPAGAALMVVCAFPPLAAAERDAISCAGGIAWIVSDELDLIGEMSIDLPFATGRSVVPYATIEARTAIERSIGELTFDVRHVDYDLEAGARWTAGRGRGLSLFIGQSGLERVDAAGEPRIRLAGVGWSSAGFRAAIPAGTLEGAVALAAVLDAEEIDADLFGRLALGLSWPWPRGSWGFDVRAEGLGGQGALRTDLAAGPRVDFELAGGRRLGLYARWIHEDSEIGLGTSGLAAGFTVVEGPGGRDRASPPDMSGAIGVGVRDGGSPLGRFRLAAASPATRRGVHAVLDVDANIRTAEDSGDLYYLVAVGAQLVRGARLWGGWLYHRSNHVLAEPNDRVTSLNVLEGGVESTGWIGPPAPASRRRGTIDYRARVGYLVTSRFGEDRRWHVRAGARWTARGPARARPFVAVETEEGDVSVRSGAVGLALRDGLEVRIERRRDEQTFARDRTTTGLWAALVF